MRFGPRTIVLSVALIGLMSVACRRPIPLQPLEAADLVPTARGREILLDAPPTALELSEDNKHLLVSSAEANRVYVFDAASGVLLSFAKVM